MQPPQPEEAGDGDEAGAGEGDGLALGAGDGEGEGEGEGDDVGMVVVATVRSAQLANSSGLTAPPGTQKPGAPVTGLTPSA